MGGRLETSALERVMPDITEECPGMGTGPIDERRRARIVIEYEQFGHHRLFAGTGILESHEEECSSDNPKEHLTKDECVSDDADNEQHEHGIAELDLALCLSFVCRNDLFAPTHGNRPDYRVVGVV